MADLTEHSATCQKLLGKAFKEVHSFLDQFFPKYGMSHRCLLHHLLGVELIAAQFGEETRTAAELHIIEDLLSGVELDQDWQNLRSQIPRSWKDYPEPLFVDLALYDEFDQDLKDLYMELIDGEKKEALSLTKKQEIVPWPCGYQAIWVSKDQGREKESYGILARTLRRLSETA